MRDHVLLHGAGALCAKRQVILSGALLVRVSFDQDVILRVILQPIDLPGQNLPR